MGYHTDFDGAFTVTPPLKPEHKAYLNAFAGTRRMARNAAKTAKMKDPLRLAVGLPIGAEGGFFVGAALLDGTSDAPGAWANCAGQAHTKDITNYNEAPSGQPGLWCQWVPNDAGTSIEWDGGEKFYSYVEWIEYLILNFLSPWGYSLNGSVEWSGEDHGDMGRIVIKNNSVTTQAAVITWQDDDHS